MVVVRRMRRLVGALALGAAVVGASSAQALADVGVGWIEIEGALLERPEPFAAALGLDGGTTLRDVVAALRAAADRPDVEAVVLRLKQPLLTPYQVEEIGQAIEQVQAAGKKVHLFTEIYNTPETLLAAWVDEAIVQPGSAVTFPGLYAEELYLADALRWLGIQPSFVQIGKYKGAEEPFVNSQPSEPWDENYSRLLDELYGAMRAPFLRYRRMSDRTLDRAMEQAVMASPEQAVELGLVDAVVDRLDLEAHLQEQYGDEVRYVTGLLPSRSGGLDMANPFAFFQLLANPVKQRPVRDTIAVLHIDGPIVDGKSQPASILGGASVGSLTIRQALKRIEDDPLVKGVIVRINSPGGSAIASESIWQGLRRVAQKKPVWTSVGSMAASGGYYIAVAGDRIFVDPSSIVGSIGVVGGKLALRGLYEKLRLHAVPRARGPRASLLSGLEPWTEEEREFIRQRMQETYDLFVDRVKQGRPDIDISRTAEGRLFAGKHAVEMRMADEVGSLAQALDAMADELGLRKGAYDVLDYPLPRSLDEILQDFMGFGLAAAPAARSGDALAQAGAQVLALRAALGEARWRQLRDALTGMLQLQREPVLLLSPRSLLLR